MKVICRACSKPMKALPAMKAGSLDLIKTKKFYQETTSKLLLFPTLPGTNASGIS